MTIAQTSERTPRKPLRLWPGVLAVVLQWLARFGITAVVPGFKAFALGAQGGLIGAVAVVVWWAFLSRAAWFERFGAIVLMIGIRMALGVQRSQLLGLVIRQGMVPVVLGLAAGIAAAFFLGRAIRGLLFKVQPTDPLTIAGVIVVLLVVGTLACLIPARRAVGMDAVAALRFE